MCTIFGGVQFFLIHNLLFKRDELIGARYDLVVAHYNLAGGLSWFDRAALWYVAAVSTA